MGGECPFLIWLGVSCLGVGCMPSEAAPQKHPAKDGGPMAGAGAGDRYGAVGGARYGADGGPMARVGAGECPCLIWLVTSGIIWWGTTGIGWLGATGIGWLGAGSAAHAAVQMAARVRASTFLRRLMRLATFQIREDH